ncbi:AraC family transcriptional regulator [Clostridiaceae bacterium OttesenSCG-928-D20]|nr:AraC family transcriptional regulator [Clostridiaceae bacterium OttesenSCG-928-D20]
MSKPMEIGVFKTTPLDAVINVEHIVTLHYFHYAKNFAFSGEKHDFWEIAYVDKGEVGVVAEGKGFNLKQGEAVFHKPNEYHNIWAKNQYANVLIISFVCNNAIMQRFHDRIISFNDKHKNILAQILKIGEKIFEDMNDVYQTRLKFSDRADEIKLQSLKNYLELLLLTLLESDSSELRQARSSQKTKLQGDSQIVEAVSRILSDNIESKISLEDILKSVCFSKSYLTKLFRDHTGKSIMSYYQELKLNRAKELISERTLSFTEIAERLRYNSIHHFSASFKKQIGMTPSEYLNSVQSIDVL